MSGELLRGVMIDLVTEDGYEWLKLIGLKFHVVNEC